MMEEEAVRATGEFDLSKIREEEFEQHTTYIVPDLPVESGTPNRAEATLPRNLVLKSSQALSDVSQKKIKIFLFAIFFIFNFFYRPKGCGAPVTSHEGRALAPSWEKSTPKTPFRVRPTGNIFGGWVKAKFSRFLYIYLICVLALNCVGIFGVALVYIFFWCRCNSEKDISVIVLTIRYLLYFGFLIIKYNFFEKHIRQPNNNDYPQNYKTYSCK